MNGSFTVRVVEIIDASFRKVVIKRPLGTVNKREFTPNAFNESLESVKNYCDYKGYKLHVYDET